VSTCEQAGIIGALAGVAGSLAALEVVRAIVGFGQPLVGRLLMIDAREMRFETLHYAWNRENPLSGEQPSIRDLSRYA
jgi:adenylyltransferase/sulfurtransferase